MTEKSQIFKKGETAAAVSAIILLALSLLKGGVALISGSVALLADSIHSFADIFSSVAVWAGLRLVQRKPIERFPYGFYRAKSFALLMVSIIILISGILIPLDAISKIFEPTTITSTNLVLAVTAVSGVTSFLLGMYKKKVGRSIGSQSLIGESQHSLVDVYTSILVFIGVCFSSVGYPIIEALAAVVIGVNVIRLARALIIDSRVGKNDAARLDRKKGISAAQFLADENIDVLLTCSLGEGPFHLLRDNLVEIYHLSSQTNVRDAFNMLNQNSLENMTAPISVE
jgi:divalent metal cation (Fe/Co/Zn/Cd) transporter